MSDIWDITLTTAIKKKKNTKKKKICCDYIFLLFDSDINGNIKI